MSIFLRAIKLPKPLDIRRLEDGLLIKTSDPLSAPSRHDKQSILNSKTALILGVLWNAHISFFASDFNFDQLLVCHKRL
jgi:hypothetical protein